MPDDIEKQNFKHLKTEFINVTKRILKKNITRNRDKLDEYKRDIIQAYNDLTKYVDKCYNKINDETLDYFRDEIIKIREKLSKCFGKLECNYKLSNDLFAGIDTGVVTDENEDSEESLSDDETSGMSKNSESNETVQEFSLNNGVNDEGTSSLNNIEETENRNTQSSENIIIEPQHLSVMPGDNDDNMARKMSNAEFIRFAAQTVHKSYSGDPLALDSFINSVELAKTIAEQDQITILKKFILTRLEGKALECVNKEGTVENIITDLRKTIKPDSSKVVEGRMLSLKLNKSNSTDFAHDAEKLAEALQRSLVIEGISLAKAKEMAVEKTVEMCRQSARTDLVKAVLASTTFNDPKEVVAKLIVEQNSQEKEHKILFFNRNNNNGGFKNNRGNFRGRGGFNGRNNYNNNNYNNNNGFNRQNNHYNNNNGGYRGRGNGRGRYNNNNNNNNGRQNYNVRVTENSNVPSDARREQNNQEPAFTLERVQRN